jgi:hypothetical protein
MKKGVSDLLRNLMSVILAIIVLAALMALVVKLFGFFALQEKDQAYGMLDTIKNTLDGMGLGANATEILIYSPKNLYFTTIANGKPAEDVIITEKCINLNCICICDETCKKKVYCLLIEKPLQQNNQSIKTKIPSAINVNKNLAEYSITNITQGVLG